MKKFVYGLARLFFRIFPRQPVITARVQKILVIKLCCIGDILFTTPLLRELKRNFPRSRITYMSCSWCRELAAASTQVEDVIEFNA
ncbi:hypothetical protein JW933_10230, partial [candidate division FCPU426 bacterium]|nr:hypothetical protein [candidate division FCPU426 bacterium]